MEGRNVKDILCKTLNQLFVYENISALCGLIMQIVCFIYTAHLYGFGVSK